MHQPLKSKTSEAFIGKTRPGLTNFTGIRQDKSIGIYARMFMRALLSHLHSETVCQLDEEGWSVSEPDANTLVLSKPGSDGLPALGIRLELRDEDVVAYVEQRPPTAGSSLATQVCSAPRKNIANLLDTALTLALKP